MGDRRDDVSISRLDGDAETLADFESRAQIIDEVRSYNILNHVAV